MKSNEHKSPDKLPYAKPVFRMVDLAAEEVLAVGCKMAGTAAPTGPPISCAQVFCSTNGS